VFEYRLYLPTQGDPLSRARNFAKQIVSQNK
jgi:hypothetical protein